MIAAGRVACGALAAMALAASLIMPARPAWAAQVPPPTIQLTPVEGPVGTKVTAFGNTCEVHEPVVDEVDETETPAETVYPDQVSLEWDGTEVADATIYADVYTYEATFVVPDDAYVGGHKVEAVCLETGQRRGVAFVVTAPEPELAVVPALVGRRVEELAGILEQAGLIVGEVGGSGDVIATQDPAAGARVQPGSAVDVTTTSRPRPRPRLVEVPSLANLEVSEASDLLADKGLRLGRVSGRGELIERQNPTAGTRVRAGSAVNVSLTSRRPQQLVPVPDLVGKSLAEARSIVPVARLVLANDSGGEGTITGQSPAPGTLVPPGSEITIELAVESSSLVEQSAPFVAGVLVLLGAAWLLSGRFRRRGRRWVRGHVVVRASEETPGSRIELSEPPDGRVPTVAISLMSRRGRGTVVMREHKR
jgi:beta-lactam-binding protein with PASTA domain